MEGRNGSASFDGQAAACYRAAGREGDAIAMFMTAGECQSHESVESHASAAKDFREAALITERQGRCDFDRGREKAWIADSDSDFDLCLRFLVCSMACSIDAMPSMADLLPLHPRGFLVSNLLCCGKLLLKLITSAVKRSLQTIILGFFLA